ncbi:MAG: amidohydrolase family protein [Deltaproteobacteria bacterium]|nr:amidohydrolase family protein [Deltaproteobacteria bacterium]
MGRKDISHIRKPEILKHAYRVVAKEGFIGATINKIAKEMGINPGTLMHYFKNKEELTLALVDYMTERIKDSYQKAYAKYDGPPERRIETMIEIHFDQEDPSLTRGSVFWSCYALGIRNPKIMAAIRNMYKIFLENTIRNLEEANAADRIKIKDPELMAYMILSTIDGLGWLRMTMDNEDLPKLKEAYQLSKMRIKELLGLPDTSGDGDSSDEEVSLREKFSLSIKTVEEERPFSSEMNSGDRINSIIDLRLPVPRSKEEIVKRMKRMFSDPKAKGLANYQRIFGPKWVEKLGMSIQDLQAKMSEMPEKDLHKMLLKLAEPLSMTPESMLSQMDENNVAWGMVFSEDNNKAAELIEKFPQHLKGMAIIDPFGSAPAKETERMVKEFGFSAIYASPFHSKITADDPKYFPVYARAQKLNIPVFIYATMNYNREVPMDIGRPIYVDRVAMAFPDLQIIASCGGWPWVHEMVGVARRHRNVYIDTSFHRPKHLATPDSGWGILLQFANTLLQDQVVFGSGMGDLGLPLSTIIQEMKDLPLKESVKKKWLYDNAAKLFGMK